MNHLLKDGVLWEVVREPRRDVFATNTAFTMTCTAPQYREWKPPQLVRASMEKLRCEYCGTPNDGYRGKCSECGAPLP